MLSAAVSRAVSQTVRIPTDCANKPASKAPTPDNERTKDTPSKYRAPAATKYAISVSNWLLSERVSRA